VIRQTRCHADKLGSCAEQGAGPVGVERLDVDRPIPPGDQRADIDAQRGQRHHPATLRLIPGASRKAQAIRPPARDTAVERQYRRISRARYRDAASGTGGVMTAILIAALSRQSARRPSAQWQEIGRGGTVSRDAVPAELLGKLAVSATPAPPIRASLFAAAECIRRILPERAVATLVPGLPFSRSRDWTIAQADAGRLAPQWSTP
jgi:hypothetical protein